MDTDRAIPARADRDAETYARLTAPVHVQQSHFSEHQRIEGYFENRDVPQFLGSDRLMKLDTLYGTIQLGYNPRRGQSFLFANIKTSIFDTAPSRHQRELKEYQMVRGRKAATANTVYTARRRAGGAVLLYKAEPLPWSQKSVLPYLRRTGVEALRKTLPFLDRGEELAAREQARRSRRELQAALAGLMARSEYGSMAAVRARQTALSAERAATEALLYRKDAQQRLFFRRLNGLLDVQKQEMFDYYRSRRQGGEAARREDTPIENNSREDRDE